MPCLISRPRGAVDVDPGESFVLVSFYKGFALLSHLFLLFTSEHSEITKHHIRGSKSIFAYFWVNFDHF